MVTKEQLADRVISNIENEKIKVEFIDPASIMVIISIVNAIITGIRLYCEWKNKKNLPVEAGRTKISKPYVRRIVRKYMKREQYKVAGNAVVDAILKTGVSITPEESEEILA